VFLAGMAAGKCCAPKGHRNLRPISENKETIQRNHRVAQLFFLEASIVRGKLAKREKMQRLAVSCLPATSLLKTRTPSGGGQSGMTALSSQSRRQRVTLHRKKCFGQASGSSSHSSGSREGKNTYELPIHLEALNPPGRIEREKKKGRLEVFVRSCLGKKKETKGGNPRSLTP